MEWAIIITVYATLFIVSPLIAILHELGHAFAYLIFTKPEYIDIYIGSYGDKNVAIHFTIGKLNFYVKISFPFIKGIGLCSSSKRETNYINAIIILLAGTVFTLFTAGLISLIILTTNANVLVEISCYIFLGLSAFSLVINLLPFRTINIYALQNDNRYLESDGEQILFTLKVKNALPKYWEAQNDIKAEMYDLAADRLKQVLTTAPKTERILRQLVTVCLYAKLYEDAEVYLSELEKKGDLRLQDILNKGCLQSVTFKHDEAIITYQKVLKRDRNNLVALNNLGEEMVRKGAFKVAQQLLDKAIAINPNFEYPYCIMGYSKILQHELVEAKSLLEKCISINEKNATAYVYLAIYYLRLGNEADANTNLKKAIELDAKIDTNDYDNELNSKARKEVI